jgi:hypothetical protein
MIKNEMPPIFTYFIDNYIEDDNFATAVDDDDA